MAAVNWGLSDATFANKPRKKRRLGKTLLNEGLMRVLDAEIALQKRLSIFLSPYGKIERKKTS